MCVGVHIFEWEGLYPLVVVYVSVCRRLTCVPIPGRSEREALETSLFEVQQQLVQLESRREQLESENQTFRLRSESSTGKTSS